MFYAVTFTTRRYKVLATDPEIQGIRLKILEWHERHRSPIVARDGRTGKRYTLAELYALELREMVQ